HLKMRASENPLDSATLEALHLELNGLRLKVDRMREDQRSTTESARLEREMMRIDHEADLRRRDRQLESAEWNRRMELNEAHNESSVKNRRLEEELQLVNKEMIKQETDHCRVLRETLNTAASEQQSLLQKLNDMQKQISVFELKGLHNELLHFRMMSRILIETMANYEIGKESSKIQEQQNELIGAFWKLEAAFINFDNASTNNESRYFFQESSEHAFFIFSVTMGSVDSTLDTLPQSSFDLLRSILSQMPIVKNNHVEVHVRRSLE
ncbi:hypothetical protein PENTCL1PPCAC_26092, partial [Pristionchus entomophagus]